MSIIDEAHLKCARLKFNFVASPSSSASLPNSDKSEFESKIKEFEAGRNVLAVS